MSIQTQIDRISDAVSAAMTALTEKGVTVPDGTKVDDLATLIAAIESGGGSGGNGPFTTWGTYTPTEDMDKVDVEIDLGVDFSGVSFSGDRLFLLLRNGSYARVNGSYEVLLHRNVVSGYTYSYGTRPGGSVYNTNTSTTMTANITIKNKRLFAIVSGATSANYTYGLKAGVEYIWAFVYPIGGT